MTLRLAQMLDTLHVGGAQKMQVFLAETLQPLGIELTVISLLDSSGSPVVAKLQASGAKVVTFPFRKLVSPRSFDHLVHFLRAEKFDLLHTYLAHSNIVGPLAGWLSGTPTIASIRSADHDHSLRGQMRAALEGFIMRYFAERVTANGRAVADYAWKRLYGQRRIDIVPNAVDFARVVFSANDRQKFLQEVSAGANGPIILSVGRLTPAKGFFDLLDAFKLVLGRHPDASLLIAGGGSLLEDLKAHVQAMSIENNVLFLGLRNDVPNLLGVADIYVNSSHWEGTPVSVLEAMACGLPIVATSVGENPYLLGEGSGVLVPPHKPESLAAAMNSLIDSPEKCVELGRAAQNSIEKSYTREAWRTCILDLYAQITPKASPYLARISTNQLQVARPDLK